MAINSLDENFRRFFTRINPSSSYEATASSEQNNVVRLLESAQGPASAIKPRCFLQGSYKQDTAIHSINDIDIVALCDLYYPGSGTGRSYDRDAIFALLADALNQDHRYRSKLRFNAGSLCIKINLEIKIEILPAVKPQGESDFDHEPFFIYRPEEGKWGTAYAREHQRLMTKKNEQADKFYKPMIKVFKHLRDVWQGLKQEDAISFHIECLLYRVPDSVFFGSIADAVEGVLSSVARFTPDQSVSSGITSPCGDKILFSESEWSKGAYTRFHAFANRWAELAYQANRKQNWSDAVKIWKDLFGDDYFPRDVS